MPSSRTTSRRRGAPERARRRTQEPPPRVVIERVTPEIDAGRYAIKRVPGEVVRVEADLIADGYDELAGVVRFRHAEDRQWRETPLAPLGNDRWHGSFTVDRLGRYLYSVTAWVDAFATWQRDLRKKADAGVSLAVDLAVGAAMVESASHGAAGSDEQELAAMAEQLLKSGDPAARLELALSESLTALMRAHPLRATAATYPLELKVVVERERARSGAWYELFPRSCAPTPDRHATFDDVMARLPYVAEMGFDVLYLPPIHPIGETHRKGKNNTSEAQPGEAGSPWAIGSSEGGHKAVHPQLGTPADFRRLVAEARRHGMEVALDLAFQCSPDHPYARQHPEWFRRLPDGSIQYAENPPKKYQDIYPFDFETAAWRALWLELKSIVSFWLDQGVSIFRVDNPHTKPFAFWEWLISEIQSDHPDVIFLAEAFTRPKIMVELAKLGFTQSYTYFTWRNTAAELRDYLTELCRSEVREYFRPNLWPNTPDILHATLQKGGRPAFMIRLLLAATLGASYGIYGPAFELCVSTPREVNSEEYLDSEKYEIKHWQLDAPHSLRPLIAQVNRIRRGHRALQRNDSLRFHEVDHGEILCYSKRDGDDVLLMVVATNPFAKQSGSVRLDLEALALPPDASFVVHDLLTDRRYTWQGPRNYVELDPAVLPAHIFAIQTP